MVNFIKSNNVMVIGVGLHAKRIYLPILFKHEVDKSFNLKFGVDFESKKEDIEQYLKSNRLELKMIYFKDYNNTDKLSKENRDRLSRLAKENNITGVVISTEPLAHKDYALWAISQGLNVLMDKPISTRKNVSHNKNEARGIYKDYKEILNAYSKLQSKKETVFSVNVQRRYESGYLKVFDLIEEVANKFNAPVTSIQAMHSDGVWIFPDEIVDQTYHPYNLGFGKGSHSSYHIFDIVWQIYKRGLVEGKKPDSAKVYSSFLNPDGLLVQFKQEDYKKFFEKEAEEKYFKRNNKELKKLYKNYGEMDIFSVIRLEQDNVNICNISLNLLHSSFSKRSWLKPNYDLYKGNGRVKHQYYNIQQGPFQCIQIHNFQSNDMQEKNTLADYNLGGNNHFDIYVFRNSKMFGEGEKPLKVYNLKDLDTKKTFEDDKLFHETAKELVILEFLDYLQGLIKLTSMKSNITSHEIPVKIMSSIYESNVEFENGNNPIIKFEI